MPQPLKTFGSAPGGFCAPFRWARFAALSAVLSTVLSTAFSVVLSTVLLVAFFTVLAATLSPVAHAAPLSFGELVAGTLESPAVRLAEEELTLARRAQEQSGSPVSLSLSGGVRGAAGTAELPSALSLEPVSLNAAFNLFPLGPGASARARAEIAVWSAETTFLEARDEALLGAIEGFLEALFSAQQGAVLRAQTDVARLELQAVRARLEAGAAGETEVLEAQLALAQSESERAANLHAEAEALGALARTLGEEVAGVTGPVPAARPTQSHAFLERRSDVQRARLALREAVLAEADARFGALPSGSLSVGYARAVGAQGLEVGASIGSESGFQPQLSASYTPFLGAEPGSIPGANEAGSLSASLGVSVALDPALPGVLESAALQVAQAEAAVESVRRLAHLEVVSRERELAASTSALRLSEQQLELSKQLRSGVETRLELGLVAPVELRRAEGARLAAQLSQLQTEHAVFLAQLRLARARAVPLTDLF